MINIVLWIIDASRPLLNETNAMDSFSTALKASRLQTKVICEQWGSRRAGRRRAVPPCIHTGSNDAAFRWLSQLGGIVRGSFPETAPRKTTENTLRFDGSQLLRWQWTFGGRNNTTVFYNIDISNLPTLICRCSSRFRCCRFSMSDVYIGRSLVSASNLMKY